MKLLLCLIIFAGTCSKIKKSEEHFEKNTCQLIVTHDECTDCQDIVIDSGVVIVPNKVKANFRGKRLMGDKWQTQINTGDMRLESDSVFEMLFGKENNWHFERRYRVKGEVISLKDSCELIFRIYMYERLEDQTF